jgi:hypothetical protein
VRMFKSIFTKRTFALSTCVASQPMAAVRTKRPNLKSPQVALWAECYRLHIQFANNFRQKPYTQKAYYKYRLNQLN